MSYEKPWPPGGGQGLGTIPSAVIGVPACTALTVYRAAESRA